MPIGPNACNGVTSNALVQCVGQLVDANSDGTVTAAEIDAYFTGNQTCLPWNMTTYMEQVNGTVIVQQCDSNSDGVLTAADTTCLQTPMARNYLCRICVSCGYNFPVIGRRNTKRHVFPPHPYPLRKMK